MHCLPWRRESKDGEEEYTRNEGDAQKDPGKFHLRVVWSVDLERVWCSMVVNGNFYLYTDQETSTMHCVTMVTHVR